MEKKEIIGVFDSGIGGLSILKELIQEMPFENFYYFSDNENSPYGEKEEEFIVQRTKVITNYFITKNNCKLKALVIACNTATAASIDVLRKEYPELPIIGVEPALKPASEQTKSKKIAVLATYGTIHSQKFKKLKASLLPSVEIFCQPCNGLAHAIEVGDLAKIKDLCKNYLSELGLLKENINNIDGLVLGCTHYPLVEKEFKELINNDVRIFEPGKSVAKRVSKVIIPSREVSRVLKFSSNKNTELLEIACKKWLGLNAEVELIEV